MLPDQTIREVPQICIEMVDLFTCVEIEDDGAPVRAAAELVMVAADCDGVDDGGIPNGTLPAGVNPSPTKTPGSVVLL